LEKSGSFGNQGFSCFLRGFFVLTPFAQGSNLHEFTENLKQSDAWPLLERKQYFVPVLYEEVP